MSLMSDEIPPGGETGKSGWWSRLFQGRADEVRTREEIAGFLLQFRERGVLSTEEYAMLQGVLEVSNTQVRDIMIPRSHMVVLAKDDSADALLKTVIESNHSRFPVIGSDRDEVVGIVLAKDLLKQCIRDRQSFNIDTLLRPAVFIPESKRLNTLLTEFRASRNHMAIVVDEYGGVSGLATIEDVLEQIVGDIDDEHDREEAASIQSQEGGRYLVLALTRIEEFNEFFNAEMSDEEYDTVGGLVMHELGRLPRRGEQLEYRGFRFKVLRGDRRRIHSLEVTRMPAAAAE
jgi:magnesium and cobalt transporter